MNTHFVGRIGEKMNFKDIPKFVINLKRRPDRLESVQKEFNKIGVNVTRWVAVDADTLKIPLDSKKKTEFNCKGILACMQSHYNLIKHAKENKYEYVCVFEDDIIMANDFHKRIEIIEKQDFDLWMLGGHYDKIRDVFPIKPFIYKCNRVAGTYAYIMKNTLFDYVLENMNYQYGSDEFFCECIQKNFDVKCFLPFLCDHIEGDISDITGRISNYNTKIHFKNNIL
jgi:GR25 family glycosyltransferase involved in LPS biosynthesis